MSNKLVIGSQKFIRRKKSKRNQTKTTKIKYMAYTLTNNKNIKRLNISIFSTIHLQTLSSPSALLKKTPEGSNFPLIPCDL